jgi:2-polyprenyl-6-methoxyphenol hydroxylase-like FAD-dependent oxidoreductase
MNMSRVTAEHVSVLIVGAGPTGLTLALDLASRGLPSHIIESTTQRAVNPRCNTTSARSMEIFRRLGLADDIRRVGLPDDYPTSIRYRTTMQGPEIYSIDLPTSAEVLAGLNRESWPGPEPQHRVSQIYLEPILEERANQTPGVSIERACRLVELEQHDEYVTATVESEGKLRVITCDYVVGCDGAWSTVRGQLGIEYHGVEAIQKFVSTFVRSTQLGELAARAKAWTYWTYGRQQASIIAINGTDLWLNHVAFPPDHDTDGEDPEQLLQEAVGGPLEHEVLGVVRWTGRQLVADRYQDRRVFLAGDAAHVWIPVGGFGMNAGIQDAASLAWMLAAVHHGWAPDSLLEAYQLERQPVGEQFAQAVGAKARASLADVSSDIHEAGAVGAKARAQLAQRLARTEPDRYSPVGFSFGYHYASSPLVLGGEDHEPITMAQFGQHARPGFRVPHAWMASGESVLDLLGPGFTLMRTDHNLPTQPWVDVAAELGVPLVVIDVPPEWPDRYPTPLILVRPDQHVAWMGGRDGDPSDILHAVTGRVGARQL